MKVSFTQKEYARLLELVHMGLWVTGSRTDIPSSTPERYAELSQKVLGLAEQFGCADLVDADEEGLLMPSPKLEDGPVRERLDAFIDTSFWEELCSRLAERDLRSELGVDTLPPQLEEEQETRLKFLEDNYWAEFEEHGVDRVHVLKAGQG